MLLLQNLWRNRVSRIFFALQIGDVLTTLLFMSRGIPESNPLAGYLMSRYGGLPGLLILKGAAVSVALLCNVTAHPKFMRSINVVYAVIVVVNLLTLFTVRPVS